jgi:hypothetical protein
MPVRLLAKSLYGLLSATFLLAGAGVLLLGTGLLPGAVRDALTGVAHGDGETLHLMQEYGCLLVFIGLITLWFIRHYDASRAFHWVMTAFWGLIALVHWFDIRGPWESVIGPLVNTVPFALFLAVGLLRETTRGRA